MFISRVISPIELLMTENSIISSSFTSLVIIVFFIGLMIVEIFDVHVVLGFGQ